MMIEDTRTAGIVLVSVMGAGYFIGCAILAGLRRPIDYAIVIGGTVVFGGLTYALMVAIA